MDGEEGLGGEAVQAVRVYADHVVRACGGVGEDLRVDFVDVAHAVLEEEDDTVRR